MEDEEEEEAASRRPHAPTATSLPARPASPPRGRPCGDRGAGGAGQRSPAGGSGEVSRHPAACGEANGSDKRRSLRGGVWERSPEEEEEEEGGMPEGAGGLGEGAEPCLPLPRAPGR